MDKTIIKVIDWINYDNTEKYEASIGSGSEIAISDTDYIKWKDYINIINPDHKEYFEALRENITENKIQFSGEKHQNAKNGVPLFSDKTVGLFSFRGWGKLMAAIWSDIDNANYSYMDFYM